MCKIETRYRTCLNGSPCLPHYRPSVTHLGFGISAAKLPDRAPFAIYARVLAAIYSGICRQPFEVTDGRILLSPRASADRREGRLSLAAFPIVRAGTVRRNPREKRTARIASCFHHKCPQRFLPGSPETDLPGRDRRRIRESYGSAVSTCGSMARPGHRKRQSLRVPKLKSKMQICCIYW